jgi:hypothetical protein
MDQETAARGARTQSVFRNGNERLVDLNEAFSGVVALGDWVCECASLDCTQRLQLTTAEYEAVRSNPRHFAVVASDYHVFTDIESVVGGNERYWLVEKTGVAGDLAARVDPRAKS